MIFENVKENIKTPVEQNWTNVQLFLVSLAFI